MPAVGACFGHGAFARCTESPLIMAEKPQILSCAFGQSAWQEKEA